MSTNAGPQRDVDAARASDGDAGVVGDASAAAPVSARAVARLVLSPRWLLWHVLTLGAMVTCGFLAAWQWHRAGSAMGSALNVGYGLQWPVFAVFFGWIWWRMLRMEIARLREADPGALDPAPVDAGVLGAPARAVDPDAADGDPRASRPGGPSPFVHRPGRVPEVTDDDDPEMAEYNRMLAALAARDREHDGR